MQSSMFNVRVPLNSRPGETFLMNTHSDAQAIVTDDVVALLDRLDTADEGVEADRATLETLFEQGFVVPDREAERRELGEFFHRVREDTTEMHVTVLTTMQCNFACDYCFQGDHGDYNQRAEKMSPEAANRVGDWLEARLDELRPESLELTFFGGEPLLNLPVMFQLAERAHAAATRRRVTLAIKIITNGLLLTPELVDRLVPLGLVGVKVTLDGDREAHNRLRPLRGGQGTFDRIIGNLRKIAGKCRISIGGNFDESSVDSYPQLLDYLSAQDFSEAISFVAFKPVFRQRPSAALPDGAIALTEVGSRGAAAGGASCLSAAGAGSSPCDSCNFAEEKMSTLRDETLRHGFPTLDGVHLGPCELHRRHAYTIGPDGSLYPCPGFTSDTRFSVGHVHAAPRATQRETAASFERHRPWESCGDCAFIPVCAGGCSVASEAEQGDKSLPTCHKGSIEAAVVSMAEDVARGQSAPAP